jgi:hypothetical protein
MKSRTTFTGLTRVFILRAHYKKGAIVIEYLDDEGLLRVWYDENYQLIDGGVLSDDVALLMDVWGMELACKMIVLGYNLDIKKTIEYGLKHCEPKSTGNDKAIVLSEIMNRIFTLAKSAIAGGVIKEHDTPANWIAWAQTKGYNTDHLNPSIQIKAFQDSIHRSKNAGCIESYSEQLKHWQSPYLTVHTKTICDTSNATVEAVTMIPTKEPKPWLIADPEDPSPEYSWYTPARYFARQLVISDPTLLSKRPLLVAKVVPMLTKAGIKKRGGKLPFSHSTVLKALSNISLG